MLEMVHKWSGNGTEIVQNPTFSPENAPDLVQPTLNAGSKCQKNCSKKGPKKRMGDARWHPSLVCHRRAWDITACNGPYRGSRDITACNETSPWTMVYHQPAVDDGVYWLPDANFAEMICEICFF